MDYPYTIIRSKRRRSSAALLVKPDGEVVVQAPLFMPKFMLDRFVKSHIRWIEKRQNELKKPKVVLKKHFESEDELKEYIKLELNKYEEIMSLKSSSLAFKHVTTYWGSCAPNGKISFNLELIYAPKKAVEYVVVHELAHLKYRGHGVRFWDLVKKYYGETNESRRILRLIGHDSRNSRRYDTI